MTRSKVSFAFGATGTELEQNVYENGVCTIIVLVCPDFTNNSTTTLAVYDTDGHKIWEDPSAPRAENNVYLITGLSIPIDYNYVIKATLSGDAGGSGGTVIAKLFIESRK